MGKTLGSWSGMRKYLEQDMLADCLKKHVRYNCTTYVGMDGCKVFEIYIDNEMIKRFSLETVNTFFIQNGYKKNSEYHGTNEYWNDFTRLVDEIPISQRTEYTDEEFCEALERYRNQPILQSIYSENPLERMFAIFDRRIGKRTLLNLKDSINKQPIWLQTFYNFRLLIEFSGEGIPLSK